MKKETLFVAFATQKGGMGKTAITVLTASYLHYTKGYHVAVIDCDYPQHSIVEMRKRDTELVMKDDYFKGLAYRQFSTLGIKAYPVKECTLDMAIPTAMKMTEQSEKHYDIIFFDLPGTLNTPGVIRTLAAMDYLFTPVSADRLVLESTLQYAIMLTENLIAPRKGNIKGLYLFWNMVDGREKTPLYGAYEKAIAELDVSILKTFLPDSKRFRKEVSDERKTVFRSTLFPVDKMLLKGSHIAELVNEICQILHLDSNGK
ncbi:MAG: ParA family protein [Bacteroidota bacterium]|nr:ParA family protein [Bacteroidota bacterium]MDP4268529.1 ParA family protein [Bacteroidota bacterium]